MKSIVGLLFVVAVISAGVSTTPNTILDDTCYSQISNSCKSGELLGKCTAKFGGYTDHVNLEFNDYICEHIGLSYKYLRLATNFNSYMKDRGGLRKLFKSYSDEAWENSIKLIKFVTMRGGSVDLNTCPTLWKTAIKKEPASTFFTEVEALTSALDWHKKLAKSSFVIHKLVSTLHTSSQKTGEHEHNTDHEKHYDPEVSAFLENNFVHEYTETVRKLTGHVNDLVGLANSTSAALGYYLFDEHLKKL